MWGAWLIFCFIVFATIMIFVELRQTDVQKDTLAEAKLVIQNQAVLKDLKEITESIAKNQVILIDNRVLWNKHFDKLQATFSQEVFLFQEQIVALKKDITDLKGEIVTLKENMLKKQEELNQSQKNVENLISAAKGKR
jgi:cell division protein FtsL